MNGEMGNKKFFQKNKKLKKFSKIKFKKHKKKNFKKNFKNFFRSISTHTGSGLKLKKFLFAICKFTCEFAMRFGVANPMWVYGRHWVER